jgi:hypothetical protein
MPSESPEDAGLLRRLRVTLAYFWRTAIGRRPFQELGIGAPERSEPGVARVLLVLNHAIRERVLFESIRRQIVDLAPRVEVSILDYRDPAFLAKAVNFRPHVVMTFPFTALTIADTFYPIKFLTNCRIVTYRAEGGLLDYSGVMVDNTFFVGYDRYGDTLVDRELFWGGKMAEYAVPLLMKQGKLSSPRRVGFVGYPEYESYFDKAADGPAELPAEIAQEMNRYPRGRIVLLITGFHGSLYTKEDIVNAKDWYDPFAADADEKLEWALSEVDRMRRFKQCWIEKTIESAKANPDVLHVLKCHPLESLIQDRQRHDPYAVLNGYSNILYLQHVPVRQLLQRCGLFLHYGSTTLAEAIILGIPSAFVYSEAIYPRRKESDFAKLSTMLVDIADLGSVIADYLREPRPFERTPQMEKALFDVFNITAANLAGTSPYKPSREIALTLLDALKEPAQAIAAEDPYLLRAMRLKAAFFGLPLQRDRMVRILREITRSSGEPPPDVRPPARESTAVH